MSPRLGEPLVSSHGLLCGVHSGLGGGLECGVNRVIQVLHWWVLVSGWRGFCGGFLRPILFEPVSRDVVLQGLTAQPLAQLFDPSLQALHEVCL